MTQTYLFAYLVPWVGLISFSMPGAVKVGCTSRGTRRVSVLGVVVLCEDSGIVIPFGSLLLLGPHWISNPSRRHETVSHPCLSSFCK